MYDSDYVMTFTMEILSISNTLKKLLLQSYYHLYYIQTIYNCKVESINNIFITYGEPLLNYINHPTLVQKWKLGLYTIVYEKIDAKVNRPSDKKIN